MVSSVSSSLTNISTCRVIQAGIDQLSKVKSADFRSTLQIIRDLGTSFHRIDDLTAVSKGRVTFIGNHLLEVLDTYGSKHPPNEVIAKVIVALANLKNALQMEVATFGWMYHPIQIYAEISKSPKLRELQEILPGIIREIQIDTIKNDEEDKDYFIIDAEPIQRYFASVNLRGMTEEFDLLMFILFSDCTIKENKLIVPFSSIPNITVLEKHLETKDIHSKLIVQILYGCSLQYALICKSYLSNELLKKALFNYLEKKVPGYEPKELADPSLQAPPVLYWFSSYLEKKPLIPLFSAILEERDLYMAKTGRSIDILFSTDFISRITLMMGNDWIEESADAYDLIRRIEVCCRKLFSKSELTSLDYQISTGGSDQYLQNQITLMNTHNRALIPRPFSILQTGSRKDFVSLAFYKYVEMVTPAKLIAVPTEEEALSAKMPSGKKKPPRDKKTDKAARKAGAGSTTECLVSTPITDTDAVAALDPVKIDTLGKATSEKAHPPMTTVVCEAIKNTRELLSTISLAPRVSAWARSPEEGLAYYRYDSSHVLDQKEMILRHRFPPAMLALVFSNLYSKQSTLQRPSGELYRHWKSVLHINGAKYILEATVDARGTLFHYYAKPLLNFADYFELTRESPVEFPPLERKEKKPTPLAEISPEGITSDAQGNANFAFEGHTYKMLLLRMP